MGTPGRWNVAGYLRLSREDGDRGESDSISNQRKLLERYIEEHPELELVRFYSDDGYTGTNFDRPGFRRLEEDITRGVVNCVLVKDCCAIMGLNQKDLENQGILT